MLPEKTLVLLCIVIAIALSAAVVIGRLYA